jgi:DNA polymerase-3 subunit gamma/tau
VGFPPQAEFLKRKAEQDEYRRATTEALRSITGRTLSLRYELREPQQTEASATVLSLSPEELVQRFVDEFNAEEILDEDEQPTEAR